MTRFRLVHIEWVDSVSTDGSWQSLDMLPLWLNETGGETIHSVGILLIQNDRHVVFTNGLQPQQADGFMAIPSFAIKSIRGLGTLDIEIDTKPIELSELDGWAGLEIEHPE